MPLAARKKNLWPMDKPKKKRFVWLYYTTDGDSGCYQIKVFSTEKKAMKYGKEKDDAYGEIGKLEVN